MGDARDNQLFSSDRSTVTGKQDLVSDIRRRIHEASGARELLQGRLNEAEIELARKGRSKLIHGPTGQELHVAIGVTDYCRRAIGDQVGSVVHPLRVALDRASRWKRETWMPKGVLPRTEPEWDQISELDNYGKHQEAIDLYPVVWESTVLVFTSDRTRRIGELPRNDHQLARQTARSRSIEWRTISPDRFRGPHVSYAAALQCELRFARGLTSDRPVLSVCDAAIDVASSLADSLERG